MGFSRMLRWVRAHWASVQHRCRRMTVTKRSVAAYDATESSGVQARYKRPLQEPQRPDRFSCRSSEGELDQTRHCLQCYNTFLQSTSQYLDYCSKECMTTSIEAAGRVSIQSINEWI